MAKEKVTGNCQISVYLGEDPSVTYREICEAQERCQTTDETYHCDPDTCRLNQARLRLKSEISGQQLLPKVVE